jgi:rubrerythrin
MAVIPVNRTEANLLRAFVCEMLASRRCLAFAARCEEEGHQHAAATLRYVAQRRAGHAEEHLKMLDGLEDALTGRPTGSDTSDNLRAAIASEQLEHDALYAGMARTARDEGLNEIADWFELLAKAGRSHAGRFRRPLETLNERGFAGFGT